ncbi:helix-turn-helix transcriptional regulator [Chromobacterium vaccinii]|uniref:helix-turn-helix transcriptional regulator n=1 Tax=Chromobacterium vaccinii TaxID=1108595 RepID=UPI003C72F213
MEAINFQSDIFYATNPSFTATDAIIEFTRPLRSLKINYFTFDRHYQDGSRVVLTNAIDWIKHYWRKEMYKLAIFENAPSSFSDGHVFWNWLNREPIYSAAAQFGIDNGVTLIERHDKHCDFYHFGAINDNSVDNEYLMGKMYFLHKFMSLFKYKLQDVIHDASKSRIVLPDFAQANSQIRGSELNHAMLAADFHSLLDRRDVSRIYVGEEFGNAYLTTKELELMRELVKGASCAEASMQLGISSDAVNKHIKNIKDRLNCRSLCQLGFVMGKLSAKNLYPFSIKHGDTT